MGAWPNHVHSHPPGSAGPGMPSYHSLSPFLFVLLSPQWFRGCSQAQGLWLGGHAQPEDGRLHGNQPQHTSLWSGLNLTNTDLMGTCPFATWPQPLTRPRGLAWRKSGSRTPEQCFQPASTSTSAEWDLEAGHFTAGFCFPLCASLHIFSLQTSLFPKRVIKC